MSNFNSITMLESITGLVAHLVETNDVEKLTALKEVCVEQKEYECAAYVRRYEKELLEANPSLILKVA